MTKKTKQPEVSPEEQELINRVDSMMKVENNIASVAKEVNESLSADLKVDPKTTVQPVTTAPDLPGKIKKTKIEQVPEETEAVEAIAAEESPESQETEAGVDEESVDLDSAETDKAVDDIVAKEGDTVMAVEDARVKKEKSKQELPVKKSSGVLAWLLLLVLLLILLGGAVYYYQPFGLQINLPF